MPKANTYDLAVFTENLKRKKPPIPIKLSADKTIYVPPAQLWSQAVIEAESDGKLVLWAKLLLGDDYAAFIAAGGTTLILNQIITDFNGADTGESAAS